MRIINICLLIIFLSANLSAGNLDAPGGPPTAGMKTLDNINKRITTGSNAGPHSLDPPGPPASTMVTLDQIFNAIPGIINTPANISDISTGKRVITRSNGQMMIITGIGFTATNSFTNTFLITNIIINTVTNSVTNTFLVTNTVTNSITNTIDTGTNIYLAMRTGSIIWSNTSGYDGFYRKGYTGGYTNADGSWNGATRFTDNLDQTVTDNVTGLMWTKVANQGTPASLGTGLGPALTAAAGCAVGGYGDWRLPNRRELGTLVDLNNWNPAIPTGHPFTSVNSTARYVVSTPYISNQNNIWFVWFLDGNINAASKFISFQYWFVRGG